jgi:hypothetical protein
MQLVPQRRGFDCGVSALSSFCHIDYADVFFVAALVAGRRIRRGLTVDQLCRIAARLKRPLIRVHHKRVDLDEDVGILGIHWNDKPRWADGHWVVLRNGTIIDPEKAAVWDVDEYMKYYKARPGTLLAERE